MAAPWIVRSIAVLLCLEVGVCTAFLADHWHPLHQRENALAHFFLGATGDERSFVLDHSPAHERRRVVRPLEAGEPKSYLHVGITDNPKPIFEQSPPSATDWTVILYNARQMGCNVAAIDHPLTWDDAGEIPLRSLDFELAAFDCAVLCVDLRRDAEAHAESIPPYLARSSVPLDNLTGNPGDLPRVNRTVLPSAATGGDNTLFAFRLLENEAVRRADEPPPPPRTFVLWGDRLVPSFPIALAMARHNVAPGEVRIELGHEIRLGNGPIIPIDPFGQILLPLAELPRAPYATAETLIQPGFPARVLQNNIPECALFVDSTGAASPPWKSPSRLLRILATLDLLKHPGQAEIHPRLSPQAEVLLLSIIALLASLFLPLSPFNRTISFLLLLLGCFLLLAGLLDLTPRHSWTPLAPVLATTCAGWILSFRLVRHLPGQQVLNA